ncbi:hypothetical protein Rhopal_003514-T1 [Rhodotorula paludigena]|uniref:Uncharacterized protein n=1 Tax=Rhodotorula paludigena TaxID=86838 RepID=A0AAV5GPA9_9BASI|nr:hypothetical protein Rhopal_003514-T1 [Rhodotorula paludigena]
MLVPKRSECLYFVNNPDLKAFLACDGQPLPIFRMEEFPNKVTGFVQGTYRANFTVGIYDGRKKRAPTGREVMIYFAQDYCSASMISFEDEPDADTRFDLFESVRVDADHTRPFSFGAVPTSDDHNRISTDDNFLDDVFSVRVTVRAIKNYKQRVVRKKDQKAPQYRDQLKMQQKDKRCIDEKSEKASFSLTASYGPLAVEPAKKSKEKETRTTYDHVREDVVDMTFKFFVVSDSWVKQWLGERATSAPPIPPPVGMVDKGDVLYFDFDAAEISENYADHRAKRQKIEATKPKQDTTMPAKAADQEAIDKDASEEVDESLADEADDEDEDEDPDDDSDDSASYVSKQQPTTSRAAATRSHTAVSSATEASPSDAPMPAVQPMVKPASFSPSQYVADQAPTPAAVRALRGTEPQPHVRFERDESAIAYLDQFQQSYVDLYGGLDPLRDYGSPVGTSWWDDQTGQQASGSGSGAAGATQM